MKSLFLSLWIFSACAASVFAQQEQHTHGETGGASEFLMQQSSGTSLDPRSAPHHMTSVQAGSWNLMFHGVAFIIDIQQTAPRGGDKFFSANWVMGMAEHPLGNGSFLFRTMLSLDPATITQRQYPLLFQTGEAAFGKPIVNGQHPHDLFMEVSLQYALRLSDDTFFSLYFAPVGDPALGPVAFPHRLSASELPQATLSHHLQDSTHIVNDVITVGIKHRFFQIEGSAFHGAEPDENRWNIDQGAIDSWSTRLTVLPTNNWAAQVSIGKLKHPEELEEGDITRSTASVSYNKPLTGGHFASTLIWGRNHKTEEKRNINSFVLEALWQFDKKNYLTGRVEWVDKDELFNNDPVTKALLDKTAGSVFRIGSYTFGYTRDINLIPALQSGFGGNVTLYSLPSTIKPFYGNHPASFLFYLRIRQKGHAGTIEHHHQM